ncbi:hypothetical protein [Pseudarthrobacter siccitolerans]
MKLFKKKPDPKLVRQFGRLRGQAIAATNRPSLSKRKSRREGKAIWQWVVEMLILVTGVIATLTVGVTQLEAVRDSLKSTTAASVFEQQQELDKVFVEMPQYAQYFEEKVEIIPPEHEVQVRAIAFRTLDHFEHIRFQIANNLFSANHVAWHEYFSESFRYSPVLCRTLLENNEVYGGTTGPHSLWANFAELPCAELGISEGS